MAAAPTIWEAPPLPSPASAVAASPASSPTTPPAPAWPSQGAPSPSTPTAASPLPTPPRPGTFTFDYRLANAAGTDDATVTITVQQPPNAQNDAFTVTQPPPSTATCSTKTAAPRRPRQPAATLTSFGGGSLGGIVTDNAAGDSVALAGAPSPSTADGSLTLINPTTDGVFTFLLPTDQRLAGTDDATVTITFSKHQLPRTTPSS